MLFNDKGSKIQQRMAASSAGVNRRQEILQSLEALKGQTALDVGCGAGHLVEDLALAVGETRRVFGIDPSKAQLQVAHKRCAEMSNV